MPGHIENRSFEDQIKCVRKGVHGADYRVILNEQKMEENLCKNGMRARLRSNDTRMRCGRTAAASAG